VLNTYGPTEGTVNASILEIHPETKSLSIGHPIANTQVYIMNGDMLCGIGVLGELCITGAGIARGYLNQPDLTAEKFVDNPYGGATRFSISA
jgi:non-ribosomal peptide synthetase component F